MTKAIDLRGVPTRRAGTAAEPRARGPPPPTTTARAGGCSCSRSRAPCRAPECSVLSWALACSEIEDSKITDYRLQFIASTNGTTV
eukprot:COSAG02_NODE_2465_length_8785_cov_21.743610_12_plen_86_part_00